MILQTLDQVKSMPKQSMVLLNNLFIFVLWMSIVAPYWVNKTIIDCMTIDCYGHLIHYITHDKRYLVDSIIEYVKIFL